MSDGLFSEILKGHVQLFDPNAGFDLASMSAELYRYQDKAPRQPTFLVNEYLMAVLNNDKAAIARLNREYRISDWKKWRRRVSEYGIDLANAFNKLDTLSKNHTDTFTWNFWYGLKYKSFGTGDMDYCHIDVKYLDGAFTIFLEYGDAYGYCDPTERKVLRKTKSPSVVVRQLKYLLKKYSDK